MNLSIRPRDEKRVFLYQSHSRSGIISANLFVATGNYSPEISDVDLLIVIYNEADEQN